MKEIDIVELVKFHGELEGGLQVAHGSSVEARARAARRAMPRPLAARTHRPEPYGALGAHSLHNSPHRLSHSTATQDHTPQTIAARARSKYHRENSDTRRRWRACGLQCGKREFIFQWARGRMRAAERRRAAPCRGVEPACSRARRLPT